MFKNLDGFKKVKEDNKSIVMKHKDGHTITVALDSVPALHRKQLHSLPMHEERDVTPKKLAKGGAVKMADGGDPDMLQPAVQGPTAGGFLNGVGNAIGAAGQWLGSTNDDDSQESDASAAPAPQATSVPSAASSDQAAPASAAPVPSQAAPAQVPQQQNGMDFYNTEASGIKGLAKAQGDVANKQAAAEQEYQKNLQKAQTKWTANQDGMMQDIASTVNDIKAGHIDPKHYMESKSAGDKVGTAIGLFLGGIGSAYTHQGNPALDFLNKQVDRDIEAQKSNQNGKMNLLNAYIAKYHNAEAGENMARATSLAALGSKIKLAAAQSGNAEAQARAQMALGQLQQQIYPMVQKANFLTQMQGISQQAKVNGQLSALPPEQLVKLTGASPEDQNKMYEEIKEKANINNIRKPSLDAFDQAAKEVRPLSGGVHTSLTAFTPGMESPSQKTWQAMANTTVKDIEGTAKQAAFDSLAKNYKPQFGDDDKTVNLKKQGWINYLDSHAAAPVSNGYGLNLENFRSTSTGSVPQVKTVNGVQYRKGPNGEAIPVR